jgi:hypothetical protein
MPSSGKVLPETEISPGWFAIMGDKAMKLSLFFKAMIFA